MTARKGTPAKAARARKPGGSGGPRKRRKAPARPRAQGDPQDSFDPDFGPGPVGSTPPEASKAGPIPGLACMGDGCVLKPLADLAGKFALRVGRGHGVSLFRAATSGIELMKALRDFLDEEIAFAERAAGKDDHPAPYTKISVE